MDRAFRRTERPRTRPRSSATAWMPPPPSSSAAAPGPGAAAASPWGCCGWSSAAARRTGRIWPLQKSSSADDMAAAVVSVAHRRHLDVPRDLTVVGFDDSTAAVTLWPPLTTIRQPVRALAAAALQLLIQDIRAGPVTDDDARATVLDHQLIERESTATPRSNPLPHPVRTMP